MSDPVNDVVMIPGDNVDNKEEPDIPWEEWFSQLNPDDDIPTEHQLIYDVAMSQVDDGSAEAEREYEAARLALQGTVVPVDYKRNKEVIEWIVSDEETPEEVREDKEKDEDVGLKNFNFCLNEVLDLRGRQSRINFLKLLFAFLPGNIYHLLLKMNARIEEDNKDRRKDRVLPVCPREFAVFLGVMFVPVMEGKKGKDLWMGNCDDGEGYRSQIDVSRFMTKHRHSQLRKYFSYLYANEAKRTTDPWWMATDAISAFNHNRRESFSQSQYEVIDESMSAFRPRTTKTGKLFHLFYMHDKNNTRNSPYLLPIVLR